MKEVVILSGVRTAIGDYGGALKHLGASDLAIKVVCEAVARARIDANEVGHVVFGNVIHGEARDMYLAREAIERTASRKILEGDHAAAGDALLAVVDEMAAAADLHDMTRTKDEFNS